MTSALQDVSVQMDRLRAELLSSLTAVVSDTVDMAFETHEESFVQAAQAVHQLHGGASGGGGGGAYGRNGKPSRGGEAKLNGGDGGDMNDYDLFHRCCQRLVKYIDGNMATSPDFAQQMDRVILACHSNASETVLRSVVTRKLWFHTKNRSDDDEQDTREEEEEEDDEEEEVVEMRIKPSRGKMAAPSKPAPRGPKKRTPAHAPPPPPPPARSAKAKSPVKKRARRESASRKVSSYAPGDDDTEEVEEEEEEVQRKRKRKRRATRIRYSDDEDEAAQNEDGDEDEDVVFVAKNDATSQPHYGQADELLTFKDAIGDMCYADRRTPAQTRFFKERLRKAIQFVDAQLCKPPKGKSCVWECAKIRRQMCNRDLPCRNKICRLWHDVEAHTDRCQNSHCEFRIRVMLRETMYKIDHKKLEVQGFRNELASKKKDLSDLKNESLPDRENFVERRLLDNEIDQLESEIENAEKDLGIFKATKKTYWATLNEIGITVEDDANDQFPEFKGHYTDKKAQRKKTPTKTARNSDERSPSSATPAAPSRSERTRRRQSTDVADSPAPPVKTRERIARRSTQQSLKVLSNGVIEVDDDEEDEANEEEDTKTDRSAEYDEDTTKPATREDAEAAESKEAEGSAENEEPENEDDTQGNDVEMKEAEPDSVEDDGGMVGETGEDKATPPEPKTTSNSVDEAQSADYVIESEEAPADAIPAPVAAESAMTSALHAFNQVVDAHSEPPTPTNKSTPSIEEEDKEPQATATADEDNAPLLPF